MTLDSTRVPQLRGMQFACPYCRHAVPVLRIEIDLTSVRVEAECRPCMAVIGREYEVEARFVYALTRPCDCDIPFDCPHTIRREVSR
jgi:transcription elongation factor Elf1